MVKYHPYQISQIYRRPNLNKGMVTRILAKLLPYRVGVEFETFGAVGSFLYPHLVNKRVRSPHHELDDLIQDKLGLVDFSEDDHKWDSNSTDLNEVRVSFNGYHQLAKFSKALEIFNQCLIIPKSNGGIHIHIDATNLGQLNIKREAIVKWFSANKIQSEILQIFNGYEGSYNKRGTSMTKGYYVRVSSYPTIEFRIARLTYSYPTLIRYIIKCTELVKRCERELAEPMKKSKLRTVTKKVSQDSVNNVPQDSTDVQALLARIRSNPILADEIMRQLSRTVSFTNRTYYGTNSTATDWVVTPF